MSSERRIQDHSNAMDIDADIVDQETVVVEPGEAVPDTSFRGDNVDFQKDVIEEVRRHHPEEGGFKNEVTTYLFDDGSMLQETIHHRVYCPTCSNTLDNPDGPHHPSQCGLEDCSVYRCPSCTGVCASCDTPLCPQHSTGHATKDETYCFECVPDVEEQRHHEREIERKKVERQRMQEERQMRAQRWQEVTDVIKLLQKKEERKQRKREKNEHETENNWWNHPSNPLPSVNTENRSEDDPFEQIRKKYR